MFKQYAINSSDAEEVIAEAITKAYPKDRLLRNVHPLWLVSEKGRPMELDIFMPASRLAIEIQGPTHFKRIFHNKRRFKAQVNNDSLKKRLCLQKGVKLIWIDYRGIFLNFRNRDVNSRSVLIQGIIESLCSSTYNFMFWKSLDVFIYE